MDGSDERTGKTAEGYVLRRSHWLRQSFNPSQRQDEGPISQQEHLRARFYKHYQKEAEEHDREFMKKYDDDLSTTLIFVRSAYR